MWWEQIRPRRSQRKCLTLAQFSETREGFFEADYGRRMAYDLECFRVLELSSIVFAVGNRNDEKYT